MASYRKKEKSTEKESFQIPKPKNKNEISVICFDQNNVVRWEYMWDIERDSTLDDKFKEIVSYCYNHISFKIGYITFYGKKSRKFYNK